VQHKYQYKENRKTGTNVDYFPSGKTRIREQVAANGIESAITEYTEAGALISEKHTRNGKPHGLWTIYHPDGRTPQIKATYLDGKLNGMRYSYYANGKIKKEEPLKFNLLAGPVKSYFEQGGLESSGEYRSNRRHGLFTTYFPNGKIHEQGQYLGDKKQGAWKEFNEQGNLLRTLIFKAGNLVETREEPQK
jgi:antitoxin component YwqK of YwqJK toxin-antitoxin module